MFQILWTLLYLVLLVEDEVGKHIEVNGGDAMDVALIVSTILAMSKLALSENCTSNHYF